MLQHYTTTNIPGTSADGGGGGIAWSSVNNAKVEDGLLADSGLIGPGGGGGTPNQLKLTNFGFKIPSGAVIDGIYVNAKVQTTSGVSGIDQDLVNLIYASGATTNANTPNPGIAWTGTLNWITHGDNSSLWGRTWTPSEINSSAFGVALAAYPGSGTAIIHIDAVEIAVYWHVELTVPEADVPTRIDYKVESRDGLYLGLLPKVTSKFAFAQDINSAGSSIVVTCGKFVKNEVTVAPLLTEAGDIITTENDLPILATTTDTVVTTGDSIDDAIFKNSNRLKVWMYNKYYPNGKLMFSGQINRVEFKYGGEDTQVKLTVYSDGLDLNNYIARGYPFAYTTDVSQTTQTGSTGIVFGGGKFGGWTTYGQSFTTGASVDNVGAINLMLKGSATVTVSLYDAPNGNLLGSATTVVSVGVATVTQFEFPQLVEVTPSTSYFFAISLPPGQTITIYRTGSDVYAGGSRYESDYSGGSGGGSFYDIGGELYFITKYGTPTTTTTYSSDDPVTDMATGILLDYNSRGGLITERDFEATGLSLTYTFVVSTILDAIKKIIELCPTGYYFTTDLGTAEIDIKQMSTNADFTVVRGRHINELNLALSIEQVKNYLLLSGGDTGGGVNLFRDYRDAVSVSNYGQRTSTKSDNRITLAATADAIGSTFIEENAEEVQETTLVVKNDKVDITQFTPGKTVGFRNFGNFIDDMVLQIVRREPNFSDGIAVLTLGHLPVRMNDEIQRINRDLLNEQTINNPSAPS